MEQPQMDERRDRLTIRTPAKLNLFFEILARRKDGFHEIETVVLPIGLYDTIEIHSSCACTAGSSISGGSGGTGGGLRFSCRTESGKDLSEAIPAEKNLAYRAAVLLAEAARFSAPAEITLVKSIPSEAGLGGGSSDAAAVLWGLNRFWRTGLSDSELAELGGRLGSDVPLFLMPGLSHGSGRGERIYPLFPIDPIWFVLAKPAAGLATGKVYGRWNGIMENRRNPDSLLTALRSGDIGAAAGEMFNRLEEPAGELWPELTPLLEKIRLFGGLTGRMTGSGTALFTPMESEESAKKLAKRLAPIFGERVWAVPSVSGESNFVIE